MNLSRPSRNASRINLLALFLEAALRTDLATAKPICTEQTVDGLVVKNARNGAANTDLPPEMTRANPL